MNIQRHRNIARRFFSEVENFDRRNPLGDLSRFFGRDSVWSLFHPFNRIEGLERAADVFWKPLLASFPCLECVPQIFMASGEGGSAVVASTGYFRGSFQNDWLNVPASSKLAYLRYGILLRCGEEKIDAVEMIVDLPLLTSQAGWRRFPQGPASQELPPAPATQDGLMFEGGDADKGKESLAKVDAMLKGLARYDRRSLASMGQNAFWHPKMMWYGPCGIGATRSLNEFQEKHQAPFLKAFPDREVSDLKVFFGEGDYVATGAMPSMRAKHTGGGWLGMPPTGKEVTMRVFDFWRVENGLIRENWVLIDLLDIFMQMELDLLSFAFPSPV